MKFLINPKYQSLHDFIHRLPSNFNNEGELVYDGRNKVRIFIVDGQKIVVKAFKRPMFHQRIDYTLLRPSKARRAYSYGMKLIELGISTPEPIACIEEYHHGLFLNGYFISTYCGDPDARIIREEPDAHDELIESLAQFLVNMHEKGFIHGDTNLSNFLYHKENDDKGYHITTIDINRSHFRSNPSQKECLESLFRLTHVRPALRKIITSYALLRNWNVQSSIDIVESRLTRFEKGKARKRKMSFRE